MGFDTLAELKDIISFVGHSKGHSKEAEDDTLIMSRCRQQSDHVHSSLCSPCSCSAEAGCTCIAEDYKGSSQKLSSEQREQCGVDLDQLELRITCNTDVHRYYQTTRTRDSAHDDVAYVMAYSLIKAVKQPRQSLA